MRAPNAHAARIQGERIRPCGEEQPGRPALCSAMEPGNPVVREHEAK